MHRLALGLLLCWSPGCRRTDSHAVTDADTKNPAAVESVLDADASQPDDPGAPEPAAALPDGPILTDAIRTARETAQRQVLPGKPPQPDLRRLPEGKLPGTALRPEPLPGFFTPLEFDQDEHPLANFEAALAELEAGTRTEPLRIAVYGASATAADFWTAYLRRYLQARFGDAGAGIVSPVPRNKWYRHHELSVNASRHWKKYNAYHRQGPHDPGWFGPMGTAMSAKSDRAWTEIGPSMHWPESRPLAWYELMYVEHRGGGSFEVKLGGETVDTVRAELPAEAEEPRLGVLRIPVDSGTPSLRIEVAGDGEVRLLGVVAESGRPGVIVDTFGVNGAKASNQRMWHEGLWRQGLERRAPDLYLFMFGNNEAADEGETVARFEASMREVLDRFAATLPEASCVLLGPGDFPRLRKGELERRPKLDKIREIERKLAAEYGCAFWNALAFMGGHGAKAAWVQAGLGKDDYLHLTRRGYVRMGMGLSDALMQHYDWIRHHDDAGQ